MRYRFGGAFHARRDPKDIDAEKSQRRRRQLRPEIHNVLALYLDPIDAQERLAFARRKRQAIGMLD